MKDLKTQKINWVFGGTFDPPHIGHFALVKSCLDQFTDSKVTVLPDLVNPKVPGYTKRPSTLFEHRMNMTRIAFDTLAPRIVVSSLEDEPLDSPYMVDKLFYLQKKNTLENFGLLIGEDQLNLLPSWHQAQKLALRFPIAVAPREHNDLEKIIHVCKTALSALDIPVFSIEKQSIRIGSKGESNISILSHNTIEAASSQFRNTKTENFMDPKVLAYIKTNSLYDLDEH